MLPVLRAIFGGEKKEMNVALFALRKHNTSGKRGISGSAGLGGIKKK
jgi:hypothetical protein